MAHPATGGQGDTVSILMGVRNGAAHLPEQLASIEGQTHTAWRLRCSDDGSSDATCAILHRFGEGNAGQVEVSEGPGEGFAANFMSLIATLPENAGHVAFADQDDVWKPDKLARAMAHLRDTDHQPTLYCARSWYWYPQTDRRVASPVRHRPASFRNALIENVAFGNTIVLNPAAARLARTAALRTDAVFAHDWWLYLLITGAGGKVIMDNGPPCLCYRQHATNVIGAGHGVMSQVRRKVMVLQGAFAQRLQMNLSALHRVRDLLTPENARLLENFAAARQATLLRRIKTLQRIGPYRQTFAGNLGFWGAAGLGHI